MTLTNTPVDAHESSSEAEPGTIRNLNEKRNVDEPSAHEKPKHYKNWPNAGGFNVHEEFKKLVQLPVTGYFPEYAAGHLYRVGPGVRKVARDPKTIKHGEPSEMRVLHWFDGFTTMHHFELSYDKANNHMSISYSSYGQVDELIEHARKTGRLEGITIGQRDPCETLYRKAKTMFEPTLTGGPNRANIGVVIRPTLANEARSLEIKGRQILSTVTDSATSKIFDAETLEPLGIARQTILHPSLNGPLSGAHAQVDTTTGEVFNYNLAFGASDTYRLWKANLSTGDIDILGEIRAKAAYIHSMFLTDNYIILCVWPAYLKGLSMLWTRTLLDSFLPFNKKNKTTWYVIDRKHGKGLVKEFKSPAFFCFHSTNAWEEMGSGESGHDVVDVVCELAEFDNTNILYRFYYDRLVSDGSGVEASHDGRFGNTSPTLSRYRLSDVPVVTSSSSKQSKLTGTAQRILSMPCPDAGDLQNINPRYLRKPHRYVWAVLDRGKSSFLDGICKSDTQTQTSLIWERDGHTPGEPIFIPAPEGETEDDGVILSVVFDGESGTSYLLCLNAQTMNELGRADVGAAVGFGFHGLHQPRS